MTLVPVAEGSVYKLYYGSTTCNIDDKDAQDVSSPKHFKSDIINQWDSIEIEQVSIQITFSLDLCHFKHILSAKLCLTFLKLY